MSGNNSEQSCENDEKINTLIKKLEEKEKLIQQLQIKLSAYEQNHVHLHLDSESDFNKNRTSLSESSVEKALLNPVVLDHIFKYLPKNEQYGLETVRGVCKAWNSVALSQKPPRFNFNADGYFYCCKLPLPPLLDNNIVRHISVAKLDIKGESKDYQNVDWDESNSLTRICQQFGNYVEILEFGTQKDSDVELDNDADFLNVWTNNWLPNLRKLTAHFCGNADLPWNLDMPAFPKLKWIDFGLSRKELAYLIMTRAVNVEEFELNSANHEILPREAELKFLKYVTMEEQVNHQLCKIVDNSRITLRKLLIESVRPLNLEEDSEPTDLDLEDQIIFTKMPNLTDLEINGFKEAPAERLLRKFGPQIVPNLRKLCVSSFPRDSNREILNDCNIPVISFLNYFRDYTHSNITSLVIRGLEDPSELVGLRHCFPQLASLEVILAFAQEYQDHDYQIDRVLLILTDFFEQTSTMKLKEVKLLLHIDCHLETLFGILNRHLDVFKGLQKLTLQKTLIPSNYAEEGCKDILDVLKQMKNMELGNLKIYVQNFMLDLTTARDIFEAVDGSNLPIYFT